MRVVERTKRIWHGIIDGTVHDADLTRQERADFRAHDANIQKLEKLRQQQSASFKGVFEYIERS